MLGIGPVFSIMHVFITLVVPGTTFEYFHVLSLSVSERVCLVTTPRGVEGILATEDIERIDCD